MNKVTAFIRPETLDDVKAALVGAGASGVTVSQAHGAGRQSGPTFIYRGSHFSPYYLPKMTVEVVIPAQLTDTVVEALARAARTGKVGDGIILISPVERVIRIRTGERDHAALSTTSPQPHAATTAQRPAIGTADTGFGPLIGATCFDLGEPCS